MDRGFEQEGVYVALFEDPILPDKVVKCVSDPAYSAVASFLATVSESTADRNSKFLSAEFDAYEPMALKKLRSICCESKLRWPTLAKVAVEHRLGRVVAGEISGSILSDTF